jgi:signal transduction histidine kinase
MEDAYLFRKVLHPDDRERVLGDMAAAAARGAAVSHEFRLVRRDGSVVWIHDAAVATDGPAGRTISGFIVDITDRRKAEMELERQNKQLRQLDRLKDEFVALVSHELRTPLTSIRGYLELLNDGSNLTAEQLRFLETIDRNAQRLQRVVGDLLFCAQVEAGKLTLELAPLDLNTVVAEAAEAARPAADAKSIDLRTELAGLPTVTGDRARLAQVVDNFVSNAIKFTPADGSVTITTRDVTDGVELAVADTGTGIPAAELPNLFRRFFRTERATSDAIPGTGLGLAIAKAIVEGHHGRISVESAEGAGTTFRVFLPL